MNLADYLSELLGQYAEVSMPGLGYFSRERINGYYNEAEGKFYPPASKVKYVASSTTDEVLTQFVAAKKNISLATAKYFTEKFVGNLKEQAALGVYPFSDLGSFETDHDQLIFKPSDHLLNDYAFYGFGTIALPKLDLPKPEAETVPVFEDTAIYPVIVETPVIEETPVIIEPPVEIEDPFEVEQPAEIVTEAPRKRWITSGWFIALVALVIVALAVWQVFIFHPSAFDKLFDSTAVVPHVKQTAKTDTTTKKDTLTDSVTKAAAVPVIKVIDTTNSIHYEVIVAAERKLPTATAEIARFKSIGVDAKIANGIPGRYFKISVGTYFTSEKADSAKNALIKLHKIAKESYTIPIIPKKN